MKSMIRSDSLGCRPVAQFQRRPPVGLVFKGWDLEKTGLRWDRAPPDLVRQVTTDGAQPSCAIRVLQTRTLDIQEPLNVARRELWWPWSLATMQPRPKVLEGKKISRLNQGGQEVPEYRGNFFFLLFHSFSIFFPALHQQNSTKTYKTIPHSTFGYLWVLHKRPPRLPLLTISPYRCYRNNFYQFLL